MVLVALCSPEVGLAIKGVYVSFRFTAADGFHTLSLQETQITRFQVLGNCSDFSFL